MLTAPGAPRSTRPTPSRRAPEAEPRSRPLGLSIGVAIALAGGALLLYAQVGEKTDDMARAQRTSASAPSSGKSRPTERASAPRSSRATRTDAGRRRPPAAGSSAPDAEAPRLRPDDVADPALKAVLAARDDPSPAGTQTLIEHLESRDAIVVAEATRALVARRATEAIAALVPIRLERAAGSGLSVIDALGKLGGAADGGDKRAAVDRLLQMLRDEKRRQAPESPGNLLQIYEALGDTQDPEAAPALEAELLDASVPRAPKVVVVQSLVEIGLASSKVALTSAQREQSAQQGDDAFEEEIRRELVAKLDDAIEAL